MALNFLNNGYFAGKVGIGTESPGIKLEVVDSTNAQLEVSGYSLETSTANAANGTILIGNNSSYRGVIDYNASSTSDLIISNTYNHATSGIRFKVSTSDAGGITAMKIRGNGNVGIGTTAPIVKLDVVGTARFADVSPRIVLQETGTAKDFSLKINTDGRLSFLNDDLTSEVLTIKQDGNVGIGTTSPTTKLNVSGNIAVSSGSYLSFIDSNLNYNKIGRNTSVGGIQITTGASATMNLLDNGNVGIGTTSPLGKLQVNEYTVASQGNQGVHGEVSVFADDGDESLFLGLKDSAYPNRGWAFNPVAYGVNSSLQIKEHGSTAVRMTIQSGGNVGIGTTSPGYKLHVLGGEIRLEKTSNDSYITSKSTIAGAWLVADDTAGYNGLILKRSGVEKWALGEIDGTNDFVLKEGRGGTERLRVKAGTGNVGIGTTSPTFKLQTNATIAGSWLGYLNGTSATFGTNNFSAVHSSTAIGTGTESGINLANNASDNGAPSPIISFSAKSASASYQHAYAAIYGIKTATGADTNWNKGDLVFATSQSTGPIERVRISSVGAVKFNNYDSTNNTGTPTYLLGTDASGNIVKTNTVPGSGAGPYLPLTAGSSYPLTGDLTISKSTPKLIFDNLAGGGLDPTLTASGTNFTISTSSITPLTIALDTGNATFAGSITTTSVSGISIDTGGNAILTLDGASGSTEAIIFKHSGTEVSRISHSNSTNLIFSTGSSVTTALTLDNSQNATFAGNINTGAAKYLRFNSAASGSDAAILFGNTSGTGGSLTFKRNSDSAVILTLNGDKNATFAGNVTLNEDLNFSTSGYADISNTGTGAMRFKPSSQTLALTLTGANATFAGDVILDSANPVIKLDGSSSEGIQFFRNGTQSWNLTSVGTSKDFKLYNNGGTNQYDLIIAHATGNATFTTQAFATVATSTGDASSTLTTKGYVDSLITGATIYRGTWDPDVSLNSGYGSPNLSTVTQTSGYYYICSADGAATPNGATTEPNTWATGDWVIWNDDIGAAGEWQKIDNSSVLSGAGTGQTVALWEGASSVTDSETLGNAPITVSGNNTTFAGDITASSSSSTIGTPKIIMQSDGTLDWGASKDYGTLTWDTGYALIQGQSGKGLKFETNNGFTALTLNTSQNATFAGDVSLGLNKSVSFNNSNDKIGSFTNGDVSMAARNHIGIYADSDGGGDGVIDFHTGDAINAGSPKMTILNNGNVGIGTTSPGAKLTVSENAAALVSSITNSSSSGSGVQITAANGTNNSLQIRNYAGGELMRVQGNGNVGIGTTGPSTGLDIQTSYQQLTLGNTSGSQAGAIGFRRGGDGQILAKIGYNGATDGNVFVAGLIGGGGSEFRLTSGNATSSVVTVSTASGEAMRVLGTNNNVGIGTTTPSSKLQVAGGIQMADDTDTAVVGKVGTMRYRTGTEYVEVTGTELVVNGDFATTATWTTSGTVAISGGTANWTNAVNGAGFFQAITFTANAFYKCEVTVSNYSSGTFRFRYPGISSPRISANGTYSFIIEANISVNTLLYLQGESGTNVNFSVDNISVLEVTAEDASYADMCMQTGASTYEWVNIVRNTY